MERLARDLDLLADLHDHVLRESGEDLLADVVATVGARGEVLSGLPSEARRRP